MSDDAKTLDDMGTDAAKWTDEFMRINPLGPDWGAMVAWFANAIEAGRTAGRRETCAHHWFVLSDDLVLCKRCGKGLT